MSDHAIVEVFAHGQGQAVPLPGNFRLPGDRVRVSRIGNSLLLEPLTTDLDGWFAELDRYTDIPFMEDGRQQPLMPERENPFG